MENKKEKLKMKKKKNIIARHKLLFVICLMAFIIVIVLFYIFFSLFIGSNDPYGDRLKGISNVNISSKEKKEVQTFLEEKDEVTKSSIRIQGKIIYIHIKVKENITLDKAKEIANETLEKFEDKQKKYYDFGYFLTQDKEDGFVVTGTKNSNSDKIVWIKS